VYTYISQNGIDTSDRDASPVISSFRTIPLNQLDRLVEDLASGVEGASTPERSDRLFPGDPGQANPLEVAHGALGVLHAFLSMGRPIPDILVEWTLRRELSPSRYPPGLYLGLSGIAWVFQELVFDSMARVAMRMAASHPLLYKESSVEYGVAGYGLACLWFFHQTGDEYYKKEAIAVGRYLMVSESRDPGTAAWRNTGRMLGYAQGGSGISLSFLYLYIVADDEEFAVFGKTILEGEASEAIGHRNGFGSLPENPSGIIEPYWRFGSAGLITSMSRYVRVFTDETHVYTAKRFLPDLQRKYTLFPGVVVGMDGIINALLDTEEMMGNVEAKIDAFGLADTISLYGIRQKGGGKLVPGDWLFRYSADYATGATGGASVLWRLRHHGGNSNFTIDETILGGGGRE